MGSEDTLVEIQDLSVDYWQNGKWTEVVEGLRLKVAPAEAFGLAGESGCGKTTTLNALLGYRLSNSRYRDGAVRFEGRDLLTLSNSELRRLWGSKIALVPQNPATALDPAMRVGSQMVEALRAHKDIAADEARERAYELLGLVDLPDPGRTFRKYPHELSGGQQQRILIATALGCDPRLVALDEPTTGLDVTTQAQILALLADLRARRGMAMFYVTHNLGVLARICTRIGVMYAGQLVEVAPTRELFYSPRHPYTQGLIASIPHVQHRERSQIVLLKGLLRRDELPPGCPFAPRCDFATSRCADEAQRLQELGPLHQVACWRSPEIPPLTERMGGDKLARAGLVQRESSRGRPLLVVENLKASYRRSTGGVLGTLRPWLVIEGVSFSINAGETFALVGESGSGKTTIARALTGLMPYVGGKAVLGEHDEITVPVAKRHKELLRSVQLVFQNPDDSLNPRRRISSIIGRPLQVFLGIRGRELGERVKALLEDVHLDPNYSNRFPGELSGGERQRVAIARALAAGPQLLLCDEILSSLDVSVQASIIRLLEDLQARLGVAYLLISHDLAVVRTLADYVAVLYHGFLCEIGDVEAVFAPPFHPYTYLLLGSVPEADPSRLPGPPAQSWGALSSEARGACPFAPRCQWKDAEVCRTSAPPWQSTSGNHRIRCHIPVEELRARDVWKDRFGGQH